MRWNRGWPEPSIISGTCRVTDEGSCFKHRPRGPNRTVVHRGVIVRILLGTALIIAGAAAQATHWVPVATGPDIDPAGLYVDKDSVKGSFRVRTVTEKFLNSYGEQTISSIEVDCHHRTWRELSRVSRSPSGSIIRKAGSLDTRRKPITPSSSQERVRRLVCEHFVSKAGPLAKRLHH